ncbi:ATP-binding protein [Endozoicomonas numazuensis]|uniref:Histidine kinase domain-containing protein n=1 Tax=Endozoicomonas numazuensis TaxID=1137799 RepID=A0A081NMD6_9GAMM|nr:ATP-binding protein [Endozoicomonas numazuensis]KEQ19609.1 hypothetical protein GZ78_06840 [Endozoicomonas numazuensis]
METSDSASIKVRARAVDLLGRQQIAGIPNALHELFKIAYDAFARKVEVDLLVKDRALILRDDGFGMTEKDFKERWLTLGTESKVGQLKHTADWLGDYGKEPRWTLGEKGIGRLAIATIGPAVLVITRAKREDGLHDTVACLIHWGIFELPGLNLEQIRIPVKTFPGGILPKQEDLAVMGKSIMEGLNELGVMVPDATKKQIASDLELMTFEPSKVMASCGEISLEGDSHGTAFIVRPYDAVLDEDLETEDTEGKTASRLQKLLTGFSNTMLPGNEAPPIKTYFRKHNLNGEIEDFISERAFFTPEEYLSADQIIEGKFDEYGQFQGLVKVYDHEPVPYTLNWSRGKGEKIKCGPFSIRFGYMMGLKHESTLPAEEWTLMDTKLSRIGGLYIFRNGVRVLPYGDSDYDFLGIESRRTKSAKDYFFSYRRILGAIEISSDQNSALKEKAGREGFIETIPYRQFKEILINLFIAVARDFYRKKGIQSDEFWLLKDEFKAQNELLKKREKLVNTQKSAFIKSLDSFFKAIEDEQYTKELDEIIAKFDSKLDALYKVESDSLPEHLHNLEQNTQKALENLKKQFQVSKPQGLGLNKSLQDDWHAYQRISSELKLNSLDPANRHVESKLTEFIDKHQKAVDKRQLIHSAISERKEQLTKSVQKSQKMANTELLKTQDIIRKSIRESKSRLSNEMATILSDFERANLSQMPSSELASFRSLLEERLESTAEKERAYLDSLHKQLDNWSRYLSEDVLPDDVTSALEQNNEALKEELESSLQWAQVGMALGIVQHEFNSTVRKIKRNIRQLQVWAKGTPPLRQLYKELSSGFMHLEEYLRLFAPMDRRLNRNKTTLVGDEIRKYLLDLFGERFEQKGIKFEVTDKFRGTVVNTYISSILPVFVNLVDNACHWLENTEKESRIIKLDYHPDGLLVENYGPGIDARHADTIFDFGFSTKENGRGMGLSISRKALRHEGMDLELLQAGKNVHPKFLVHVTHEINESDNPSLELEF